MSASSPNTTHQHRENMTDQSTRTPSIQTSGTPNILLHV